MDDVERLFQCFKCGVSPPQSAFRESRGDKQKSKRASPVKDGFQCVDSPTLKTPNKGQQNVADFQLHQQKFGSMATGGNKHNKRKHFSPVVFYGSPHGVPPKRPKHLLRLLREIHVDLAEQKKIREDVWATFPRQEEAIKYAKEHRRVRVFSYQDHLNGQRRFLASAYEEFWRRYKDMNPKFRHHYEVIQEGLPCHLYFDLEFNKSENVGKNGDEMVDLLISVVFDVLLEKYSIMGDRDCIVELDSSTEEKFSRHLIFHLEKTAFKDNSHVGAFVFEICSRIYSAQDNDSRLEKLFILKDSSCVGSSQLFVDTAVYTRNRCFRLPLSSKSGKTAVLVPSGRFRCKTLGEEDVFMASLICNIDIDCEKLLICKMDLDCVKTLQFDTEKQFGVSHAFTSCSSEDKTYLMGKSPFPAVDAFVESIASTGNIAGKIRSWYWFSEYGLIVYNMLRNRYCERIGREHKSNHVIYVVDLRRLAYYQKCHDPDCKGYRSPLRTIPEDAVPDEALLFGSDGSNRGLIDEGLETIETPSKSEWWLEAIEVAQQIENMPQILETSEKNITPTGDEDWWTEVERMTFEAAQTSF